MNIIYQRASRVLTYTGPDSGSSIQALDFIQELGEHIRERGSERAASGFPSANDPRWTALHEFFQRPWPSRLWIVQEFLLSQSPPILLCGRREVSWNLILELVLLAHDGYFPFVVRHSDTDPASSLLWLGELRVAASDASTRKGMTLVELLRACRARHCVDTRDKTFAVLSLASDAEELQIRADYNVSTPELYTKVAATIIQNAQSLEILKSAGYRKPSDLPSWVPDWTTDRVTVPLDMNDFLFVKNAKKSTYMFSTGGKSEFSTTINADAYSEVLSFRGTIVDQLSCLTEVICAKTRTKDHSWMAWLQQTMEAFDTSKYGKEGAMEMAFWRIMCGGRTHDRQKFAEQFLRGLRRGIHLRRLCRTTGGFIGLVPSHAREGDEVCIVRGTRVPLLLRACGEFWLFIGECYIHGIMDGEALQFHGLQTQDVKVV
ncbi:hypothetical protein NA56DRAFT_698587 [Hyaloscypha hepaticicola]|uniref:Heterokaryon incompatibility domain-containing protein n=1 Tax=Hyaloscypha hepaticicola TaxID=2082293 RepID=A0A2J6QJI5_9HELO|nr:hypothetical protein NA56DRAFT_698587 [Hyaloscypha hepaticicola]